MTELWRLSIREAMRQRWEQGRRQYRTSPDAPFEGDPLAEEYVEYLDAANYREEYCRHRYGDDPRRWPVRHTEHLNRIMELLLATRREIRQQRRESL